MGEVKKNNESDPSVLSKLNESDRKPSDDPKDKSDDTVLSDLNDSDRK